jgi:nitrogen fixation NifU-like protein
MSAAVKGKSVTEARDLIRTFKSMMSIHETKLDGESSKDSDGADDVDIFSVDRGSLGELAALQGVVKFPVRIKCATLSWNALAQGLDEVEQ